VYEPMVLVCPEGGWSLRTSLVVTPDAAARGLAFHADCYTPTLQLASTQPVRSTATAERRGRRVSKPRRVRTLSAGGAL
jgi:hypothetical protein